MLKIVGQIAPKKDNLYHVGLMVEAGSEARVDAYSTSMSQFAVSSLGVVDKPDANGSVSSLACGKNTICVGSFTSRVEWVNLEGQKYQYTGKDLLNRGSYFSSWGELADGRKLPHITAPGMGINSSYSSYFVEGGCPSLPPWLRRRPQMTIKRITGHLSKARPWHALMWQG